MSSKTEDILGVCAVALFAAACAACLILTPQPNISDMQTSESVCRAQDGENQNPLEQYFATLAQNATADAAICYWLKEFEPGADAENPESYVAADTVSVPQQALKQILDPKFYIEMGENVPMSMFMPIAKVEYTDKDGGKVSILYSFLNAEAQIYESGKSPKAVRLYDPDLLNKILESL